MIKKKDRKILNTCMQYVNQKQNHTKSQESNYALNNLGVVRGFGHKAIL
jgi:hypothetical protein